MRGRPCAAFLAALTLTTGVVVGTGSAPVAAQGPQVLRVGSWNGISGAYSSIQAAVDAARPGDWILVAPGDYHESGSAGSEPAGVLITTADLHIRGMERNQVIIDGTRRGAPTCSSHALDQVPGRNGIDVYRADDVWLENLTVCNFVTDTGGAQGNEIWWNGGDGSGRIGLHGFWGDHLTATSTYSNGVNYPAGNYGIFTSNASGGSVNDSYASNMADSAFYVGACQQACDTVLNRDHGEDSALCLSSTNAGGYLLVENMRCDRNKSGLVSNSQNNEDWPSPQDGLCPPGVVGPLGTDSCTVWMNNDIEDNNNPNVPGNGVDGLAGGAPVGTGMILAGSTYVTLDHNTVTGNGAWGELIADLPDQESAPRQDPVQCQGGIWVAAATLCYYPAYGNVSIDNHFSGNGFFGNPSNGDIGLATLPHDPGSCFQGDSDQKGLTTDPAGVETNPAYRPSQGMCTSPNSGDMGVLGAEALCATQLLTPCPDLEKLCSLDAALPCIPAPVDPIDYPRPTRVVLSMPPPQTTMPDPCAGVPTNPWCP